MSCSSEPANIQTEVLVIGGGASGTTAAIQAARTGAKVLLVEETVWLGGMLTSAGVSATDGNHRLPSGLWGEFRQKLYDHYGGPEAVFTGWVSNTQFEPHIGQQFLADMVDAEPNILRKHGWRLTQVHRSGNQITGASFSNESGDDLHVEAAMTIEATELGDVLGLGNVPHWIGQDSPDDPHNAHVQDLTYTAILQDFGDGTDHLLEKPANYDPEEFACFCLELCPDSSGEKLNCETVMNYALLPNKKYLLNWPRRGNDYFVDATRLTQEEREQEYDAAKKRTIDLVYFIQQEVGFKHLGLATDEFPTADHLPLIPYHREARRVQGLERLEVKDLQDPYRTDRPPLYHSAIAVGDYPLDHHHDKNSEAQPEEYPPIPSFSVPYESLIPKEVDGLIVAEKSISVSHMVNGASRLQPCVMLIGQAAGAAAALSVRQGVQARELNVRLLQEELLKSDCWLMPFIDVSPDDWFFESVQKTALAGIIRGNGVPYQWANQTWFYPDSAIRACDMPIWVDGKISQIPLPSDCSDPSALMTRSSAVLTIWEAIGRPEADQPNHFYTDIKNENLGLAISYFEGKGWLSNWVEGSTFYPQKPMVRKEFAWLMDQIFDPFNG